MFVTKDDLEDLSTFTGMTKDSCLARLRAYSPHELANEWRRASPQTPDEIMSFYASTELYVWELMQWHESGPIALLGDFDLVRRAIPANRVAISCSAAAGWVRMDCS